MSEHPLNLDELEQRLNGHSVFAPSASKMWLSCSGSLIPNLLAADSAGFDAAQGTVAHAVGEEWLRSGYRPTHRVGEVVKVVEHDKTFEITIDDTMLDYVSEYVAWCRELPGVHLVEVRVDFSDLTPIPNQGGTSDHIALQPRVLTITDLKYGVGVQVFAEDNTQGLLYAYGAFRKYDELFDFDEIVIRICQPRLSHFDTWRISREQLLEFAKYARKRAYAAWEPDAPRTPTKEGCLWCRVKAGCAANAVLQERLLDGVFDNLEAPVTVEEERRLKEDLDGGLYYMKRRDIRALTTEQMASLLPFRKAAESWWKNLDEELERRCINGEHVPGYKLVESRTNRAFRDEDEAGMTLVDAGVPFDSVYPRGMISPAQSEDALRKAGIEKKAIPEILEPLVTKPKGKPTMAPLSDKRPAIESVIASSFDNLDETL